MLGFKFLNLRLRKFRLILPLVKRISNDVKNTIVQHLLTK